MVGQSAYGGRAAAARLDAVELLSARISSRGGCFLVRSVLEFDGGDLPLVGVGRDGLPRGWFENAGRCENSQACGGTRFLTASLAWMFLQTS